MGANMKSLAINDEERIDSFSVDLFAETVVETVKLPMTAKAIRKDVQGLRCLAVTAVLLFHLWPHQILNGAFGVDIFFVISGHLMKLLASKSYSIDLTFTMDFYYRRLRRLLPLYMVLVIITTISSRLMKKESDKALEEAVFAASFVSNTYGLPESGYFGVSNEYPLFLHTWSLSTEMQFYLFCPLILFVGRSISFYAAMEQFFYFVLIVASFCTQIVFRDDENFSHMALVCRLWQFLLGFLTFDLCRKTETGRHNGFLRSLGGIIVAIFTATALSSSISGSFLADRVIVTISAALLIIIGEAKLLEADKLVWLGNCSYGVYLVHWPIFTIHKYFFRVDYNEYGARFTDGIVLIITAIYLGQLLESTVTRLTMRFVNRGTHLLSLAGFLYGSLAIVVVVLAFSSKMRSYKTKMVELKMSGEFWDEEIVLDKTVKIYKYPNEYSNWTASEVDTWNRLTMENPKLQDRPRLPTTYQYNNNSRLWYWVGTYYGEGNLEMVLIGNSWASNIVFGLYYHFRKSFKRLTLFATYSCSIFTAKMPSNKAREAECRIVKDDFIPILKNWDRPIDIFLIHMYWGLVELRKFDPNDSLQTELTKFFHALENLKPKAIFTLVNHLRWNDTFGDFASHVEKRRKMTTSYSLHNSFYRQKVMWKRIGAANCSKCILYETEPAFCEVMNDTCRFTDYTGRSLYRDSRHLTQLGGLYVASVIKNVFDKWQYMNNYY